MNPVGRCTCGSAIEVDVQGDENMAVHVADGLTLLMTRDRTQWADEAAWSREVVARVLAKTNCTFGRIASPVTWPEDPEAKTAVAWAQLHDAEPDGFGIAGRIPRVPRVAMRFQKPWNPSADNAAENVSDATWRRLGVVAEVSWVTFWNASQGGRCVFQLQLPKPIGALPQDTVTLPRGSVRL